MKGEVYDESNMEKFILANSKPTGLGMKLGLRFRVRLSVRVN